jgi:hypothetical protein
VPSDCFVRGRHPRCSSVNARFGLSMPNKRMERTRKTRRSS